MPPLVSVVVPNFNYVRFLPARLESVLGQTLADMEVVVLDDASTDDSVAAIARYEVDRRLRLITSQRNSGNPFVQWNRGVAATTGRYVWIAEADDWADLRFLERLVPLLEACPRVAFVHCPFFRVDDAGQPEDLSTRWWRELDPDRWRHDFVAPGREELRFLARWNVVANASGVVFRRSSWEAVGGVKESYRLAGDWDLWIRMCFVGDVGFVAAPLNYWRWHGGTQRQRAERGRFAMAEIEQVLSALAVRIGCHPRAVVAAHHRTAVESALHWRDAPRARRHARALMRTSPAVPAHWMLALRSEALALRRGLGGLRHGEQVTRRQT